MAVPLYARTVGKCFDVEQGTSIDSSEIVAVNEQNTPAVMVASSWIVAVDIPVGVGNNPTARADTSGDSTAVGGKLEENVVMLPGSSVHRGRSKSEKAVWEFVPEVEMGCDQARP